MALQGSNPSIQDILDVKNLITSSMDLRAPVMLEQQLLENDNMDTEVGLAMMQLLKVQKKPIQVSTILPKKPKLALAGLQISVSYVGI